jgi:hypothetical protein
VIPPSQNDEFVAHMEDILDLYKRPYNPDIPLICMDEQPIQLINEVRHPLPARPNCVERYDYEYQRNGTANIFMFTEPLNGWRKVSVRKKKKKVDWAMEIHSLMTEDYPNADRVILVCDNYNTHTNGALFRTFEPKEAAGIMRRLEIHHTPKHGSWLNIAEIELSALTRQCLNGRRIGDFEMVRFETKEWEKSRNSNQVSVDWQFTAKDARIKLKRLYPQIKMS